MLLTARRADWLLQVFVMAAKVVNSLLDLLKIRMCQVPGQIVLRNQCA